MNLCKDCVHMWATRRAYCARTAETRIDPVEGYEQINTKTTPLCHDERESGECGPEGKFHRKRPWWKLS